MLAPDISVTIDDIHREQMVVLHGIAGSGTFGPTVTPFEVENEGIAGFTTFQFIHVAPGVASLDMAEGSGPSANITFHDATYGATGKNLTGMGGYISEGPVPGEIVTLRKSGTATDLVVSSAADLLGDHTYSYVAVGDDATGMTAPTLLLCEDWPAPSCKAISP